MKVHELTLDQLGTLSRGRSRHRPRDAAFLYGGQYPFIQTGDVKKAGLYLCEFKQTYSEAGLAQSRLWPVGTLCITIAANIAETSILDIDACFPDSVMGFIADREKADTRFVKYLFDSVLKMRFRAFTQGAAQDNLSQEKLLSIKFPVPELPIQKLIADILSNYDDLIENNRRRIALLEEAARLLYREWFVHFRFPGHEHIKVLDSVPNGWRQGKVSDFYDTGSGGTPSRKIPKYFEPKIPWVKTQELANKFIVETDEGISEEAVRCSSAKVFPSRTVLIAMYGATVGELGILAMPGACNQACCAVIPRDKAAHFIHAFLFFSDNKERLRTLSAGSAQRNISQEVIRTFPMLFPVGTVLKSFVEVLAPSFEPWLNLQQQNRQLIVGRDLLLPRLMNGEIAV